MKAGYVLNMERNPRVHPKVRDGLRSRGHTGTAHLFPTTIRMSANAGWLLTFQAAQRMRERCAFSGRNSSVFGLIWMAGL